MKTLKNILSSGKQTLEKIIFPAIIGAGLLLSPNNARGQASQISIPPNPSDSGIYFDTTYSLNMYRTSYEYRELQRDADFWQARKNAEQKRLSEIALDANGGINLICIDYNNMWEFAYHMDLPICVSPKTEEEEEKLKQDMINKETPSFVFEDLADQEHLLLETYPRLYVTGKLRMTYESLTNQIALVDSCYDKGDITNLLIFVHRIASGLDKISSLNISIAEKKVVLTREDIAMKEEYEKKAKNFEESERFRKMLGIFDDFWQREAIPKLYRNVELEPFRLIKFRYSEKTAESSILNPESR